MKKWYVILILGFLTSGFAQQPVMQTLTGEGPLSCPQDVTLTLQGSEVGFDYYLRDDADNSVVTGPVAGTGSALDFQAGAVSQTTTYHVLASSPSNHALAFDGADDAIEIANSASLQPTLEITIEAWIYPTDITTNTYHEIFRKENNGVGRILLSFQDHGTHLSFGLDTLDDGYLEVDADIDSVDFINKWVHVMATYDGSNLKVFQDGVEIGSVVATGAITQPVFASHGYIGSASGVNEFFEGKMSSLRLWDKALITPNEIQQAQEDFFEGSESNLVAYYDFNENSGLVLNDATVNANHGTIQNGAAWASGPMGEVGKIISNTQTITDNPQTTVYVDQSATGNQCGDSWVNAKTSVQEGVNHVAEGGELLIAQGVYQQGSEVHISKALTIKGGYPIGGGTQDINNNPTTIDGSGSHRVLYAMAEITLDGLIIQNGRSILNGAGINGTAITLTNSQVIGNAIVNLNADSFSYGGGVYGDTITLIASQVSSNFISISTSQIISIRSFGGGVYGNTINLINSQINNNRANTENFTFGSGSFGGGVYGVTINLTNSQVSRNRTDSFSLSSASTSQGGGIYGLDTVNLTNSLVGGNFASAASGVISVANAAGAGIYGNTAMQNAVLWRNLKETDGDPPVSSEHEVGVLTVNHGLIKDQNPTGVGNVDATVMGFDPLFVDEGVGNFRLQSGSPLLDVGDFNLLPLDVDDIDDDGDLTERIPLDLDGMSRESGMNVDIGPYEFQHIYFVGGVIFGLLPGNSMTLQNNGADDLLIDQDGAFAFSFPMAFDDDYAVSIQAEPNNPIQPCMVTNGTGTISNQDITDVLITCELGNDLIFRDGFE